MIRFMLAAWLCTIMLPVQACDVCGCGSAGDVWGIVPDYQRHFIGLRSQWRSFQGRHPYTSKGEQPYLISDRFINSELMMRYSTGKGLQVLGIIPYRYNTRIEGNKESVFQGIGDMSLHAQWLVINAAGKIWGHNVVLTAGVEMPTGRFVHSHDIPSSIQPGSGSWDFPISIGYNAKTQNFGMNAEVSHRRNGSTSGDFVWGNTTAADLRFFVIRNGDKARTMLWSGLALDHYEKNLEYPEYGIYEAYSGGNFLLLKGGIEYFAQNHSFGLEAGKPLDQDFAGGLTKMKLQASFRLTYFINRKITSCK